MRDQINTAMKDAMRAKDSARLSTVRLMNAAIKERDIAARSDGNSDGVSDADILGILAKMIKQRQESAKVYEEAGRIELAESERAEIVVIEEFLPKQLSDDEVAKAVKDTVSEVGAESIRDMGKVMGLLKERYSGQMDFGVAGAAVKKALG
ncbi:MAG: GatB/YqeY domain-containing protein [Pseudomonadota bacterium]